MFSSLRVISAFNTVCPKVLRSNGVGDLQPMEQFDLAPKEKWWQWPGPNATIPPASDQSSVFWSTT